MGCGSSRPEPEATPNAPPPRSHISAPSKVDSYQPGGLRSTSETIRLPTELSKPFDIGPVLQARITRAGDPCTAGRAPVKVDLPPPIDAPKQTGTVLKRCKLNNHARPRDPFFSDSKSCDTLSYSWTNSHKPERSDFNFGEVSPIDESSTK